MRTRISDHIRSNVVGYVALFVALSGTAWALANDSVRSRHIKDGQVKEQDIKSDAVNGAKVLNESLTSVDITNIGGVDVSDNTLTGSDVDESQLGAVPVATLGGLGRTATDDLCDPESSTFTTCVSVGLQLPAQTRVLLVGSGLGKPEVDANLATGVCQLGTSVGGGLAGTQMFVESERVDQASAGGDFALTAVTPLLGPGSVSFGIDCNQGTNGAISYGDFMLSAVALSPG